MDLIEALPGRIEKLLPDLLAPDETVLVKLAGAFKEGLVCTDRQVLILKGGFMTGQMFGNDTFQQPYTNIAGVQVKKHFLSGYLEISAGGMQNTKKSYWSSKEGSSPEKAPNCVSLNRSEQFQKFRAAATMIMERAHQARQGGPANQGTVDIPAQIQKLAELRDAGILSEAEFSAKKEELLKRL
ncbi:MAG: SHOCT domain-containing protein [Candidatus Dormibacteraceae bacterium]